MISDSRRAPSAASAFSHALAIFSAAALLTASAGFGAYFAWISNAALPIVAGLAVAMALGLEIAKPLAVHAVFRSLRSFRVLQAGALLFLALVAIGYSIVAELQLVALTRSDAVAVRGHDTTVVGEARARRDALHRYLDSIVPSRSVAELEPLIAAKVAATKGADCNQWLPDSGLRGACLAVAQLRAEAARAAMRADIEDKIDDATRIIAKAGPERVADPSAVALSTYLAAIGAPVDPKRVADWLALVFVLALETGSAFAAVLVAATKPPARSVPTTGVREQQSAAPPPNTSATARAPALPLLAVEPLSADATLPNVSRFSFADEPGTRLLELVAQRGGEVFGSQRAIAKAVGLSAGHFNRVLHELAAAKRVTVSPTATGTRIQLL